jgi:hypothetical protein
MLLREIWTRKFMVLLLIAFLHSLNGSTLGAHLSLMALIPLLLRVQLSIKIGVVTITSIIRRILEREDMMKRSNNLSKSTFLHLTSETEQLNQCSFPTDLMHLLLKVLLSIKESISTSITKNQILPLMKKKKLMSRFMDLSKTMFLELMRLSIPNQLRLTTAKRMLSASINTR